MASRSLQRQVHPGLSKWISDPVKRQEGAGREGLPFLLPSWPLSPFWRGLTDSLSPYVRNPGLGAEPHGIPAPPGGSQQTETSSSRSERCTNQGSPGQRGPLTQAGPKWRKGCPSGAFLQMRHSSHRVGQSRHCAKRCPRETKGRPWETLSWPCHPLPAWPGGPPEAEAWTSFSGSLRVHTSCLPDLHPTWSPAWTCLSEAPL